MNDNENLKKIQEVAALLANGATSEQIEVTLGLRIHQVEAIREHLARPGGGYQTPPGGGSPDEHLVISPSQWEGPASSLVTRLLDHQPQTGDQTDIRDTIL